MAWTTARCTICSTRPMLLITTRGRSSFCYVPVVVVQFSWPIRKPHTIRQLKLSPVGETYNDIETVYQGDDQGKGCYFAIIDNQSSARYEAEQSVLYSYPKVDNIDNELAKVRQKFSPQVVTVIPDNCVNKQQQAALAAKRSEEDRKLQQWVAQQSLAELCRRTGNC